MAQVTLCKLARLIRFENNGCPIITIPEKWRIKPVLKDNPVVYYNGRLLMYRPSEKKGQPFILSNGRFLATAPPAHFERILAECKADMIAVTIDPALSACREKVLFTTNGNIAGFCRLYSDSVQPARMSEDWPHHIFIRPAGVGRALGDYMLPKSFKAFCERCENKSVKSCGIKIGGTVLDLETEAGLLSFLTANLDAPDYPGRIEKTTLRKSKNMKSGSIEISPQAKIFGKVIFGKNVRIARDAIVIGPSIIGDDVKIASQALVRVSVIGPGVEIPAAAVIQNRVIFATEPIRKFSSIRSKPALPHAAGACPPKQNLRQWRWFSYARLGKRIADIAASVAVIILFAPVFPVIALAIKLNSPGGVFFRDRRQGRGGKEFYCLKFRTMFTGAEKIQDNLRSQNEVDGPQFKVEDDPRVTAVGRFLRDTYLDEIPQFINILLGQMSVVGPRPSPESENSQCPFWRDARLSVRPGITGLWQICRTRQPHRDFQEWIYYDTQYTRNLSLLLDLSVCRRTAAKLIINFIDRF